MALWHGGGSHIPKQTHLLKVRLEGRIPLQPQPCIKFHTYVLILKQSMLEYTCTKWGKQARLFVDRDYMKTQEECTAGIKLLKNIGT